MSILEIFNTGEKQKNIVITKTLRDIILIIDTTYFKQSFGVILFKDAYS